MEKTARLAFRTDALTKGALRRIAKADRRTLSSLVLKIIDEWEAKQQMPLRSLVERQAAVCAAWNRIEEAEPDISTERLLMMVADETGEDYGDVAALRAGEDPDR